MSSKNLAEKLIEHIKSSLSVIEYSLGDVTKILVTEKYTPYVVFEAMPIREINMFEDYKELSLNTETTNRYITDYRKVYRFDENGISFFVNFLYNKNRDDFIIYIGASNNFFLKNLIKDLREITKLTVEVVK